MTLSRKNTTCNMIRPKVKLLSLTLTPLPTVPKCTFFLSLRLHHNFEYVVNRECIILIHVFATSVEIHEKKDSIFSLFNKLMRGGTVL